MKIIQTTIPNMLVQHRGNQSKVASVLDVNRTTVKKYAKDLHGDRHVIRLYYRDIESSDFDHAQLMVATCGRKQGRL